MRAPEYYLITDTYSGCLKRIAWLQKSIGCGTKINEDCQNLAELEGLLIHCRYAPTLQEHWPRIHTLLLALAPVFQARDGQQARASKRRPDRLQLLVDLLVSKSPNLTERELLRRLIQLAGKGVIDAAQDMRSVTQDEELCWLDDKGKPKLTRITGLKDRLSRAKRKHREGRWSGFGN